MKKVGALLKRVVDSRDVRARAYELGVAGLTVFATADVADGDTFGAVLKTVAGLLLVVARSYVPPKA